MRLFVFFSILLFSGTAHPARAQVEPGEFTNLREAVVSTPPNVAKILVALKSWKIERDLVDVWATAWGSDSRVFEALDGCFIGGNEAAESAKRLIALRDRTLSEKEINRAATEMMGQLDSMPKADLKRFRNFVTVIGKRLEKK